MSGPATKSINTEMKKVMADSFKKQLFRQLVIGLGVLVALLAGTQFAVWEFQKTAKRINAQKSELVFRSQATDQLASLKNDFEKAKPLLSALNEVLPPKDQLINFGKELSDLAKQRKIDLGFTFGGEAPAENGAPGFIKFAMTAETNYSNFVGFLTDIERSRFFIKFNSMDMNRVSGTDKFNILASGQVFFQ